MELVQRPRATAGIQLAGRLLLAARTGQLCGALAPRLHSAATRDAGRRRHRRVRAGPGARPGCRGVRVRRHRVRVGRSLLHRPRLAPRLGGLVGRVDPRGMRTGAAGTPPVALGRHAGGGRGGGHLRRAARHAFGGGTGDRRLRGGDAGPACQSARRIRPGPATPDRHRARCPGRLRARRAVAAAGLAADLGVGAQCARRLPGPSRAGPDPPSHPELRRHPGRRQPVARQRLHRVGHVRRRHRRRARRGGSGNRVATARDPGTRRGPVSGSGRRLRVSPGPPDRHAASRRPPRLELPPRAVEPGRGGPRRHRPRRPRPVLAVRGGAPPDSRRFRRGSAPPRGVVAPRSGPPHRTRIDPALAGLRMADHRGAVRLSRDRCALNRRPGDEAKSNDLRRATQGCRPEVGSLGCCRTVGL